MGFYSRYTAAFLILALLSPKAFSAVRVPVIQNDEYIRQVLSRQTATTGAVTTPAGDVAFFGPDKVYAFNAGDSVRPTIREVKSTVGTPSFPYGPGAAYPSDPNLTPEAATRVKVKPQTVVPKSKILTALKDGLKTNPGHLAMTATISAALGAVGWIIDESSQSPVILKPSPTTFEGLPITVASSGFQPLSCSWDRRGLFTESSTAPVIYKLFSLPGSPGSGWEFVNHCGSFGWATKQLPGGIATLPKDQPQPLTDTDLDTLDPWVSSQSAEWLGGLIRDVCNGSPNPGNCFAEMADRSKATIQGPALVAGPITSKTTQIPNPDGTTTTRTETTKTDFKITYGKDHFDVETEKKTTVLEDGQLVSETTERDDTPPQDMADLTPDPDQQEEPEYTFEDSSFPDVEPFYEQKYPDGLSGVWEQAKADIDSSAFMSFLSSFVPSFSGSCPTFGMSFAIGNLANFGAQDFQSLCYVFDFIKVIMLFGAVVVARQLTFGG